MADQTAMKDSLEAIKAQTDFDSLRKSYEAALTATYGEDNINLIDALSESYKDITEGTWIADQLKDWSPQSDAEKRRDAMDMKSGYHDIKDEEGNVIGSAFTQEDIKDAQGNIITKGYDTEKEEFTKGQRSQFSNLAYAYQYLQDMKASGDTDKYNKALEQYQNMTKEFQDLGGVLTDDYLEASKMKKAVVAAASTYYGGNGSNWYQYSKRTGSAWEESSDEYQAVKNHYKNIRQVGSHASGQPINRRVDSLGSWEEFLKSAPNGLYWDTADNLHFVKENGKLYAMQTINVGSWDAWSKFVKGQSGVDGVKFYNRAAGFDTGHGDLFSKTTEFNPTWTHERHEDGTLDANGVSLINEKGIEGIVTPQGTLTALPAHSGVVPADVTANVWQLGELAPNLIKQFASLRTEVQRNTTPTIDDDSMNIDHLYLQLQADDTFDVQKFNQQLRAAINTTKHNRAY